MPESQFYTRRGDDGYTGLLGRERVPKYDPRPEAYGTVDEVQAVLGLVRASGPTPRSGEVLLAIQRDLYALMAELAAAGAATGAAGSPFAGSITAAHVDRLEAWIAEVEGQVEMPKEFVVPGDSQAGAVLHVARTVTRRAERAAVRLYHEGLLGNDLAVRYLNRLSSLLFALAMIEDRRATGRETTLASG
jgi:cob(I)alamin adenosyltransferase